jgi:universal stress protein E
MSIERILVDIDPARDNAAAIARAAGLARATGAYLELFTGTWTHWLEGLPGAGSARDDAGRDAYLGELRRWLKDIAEPLAASGLSVGTYAVWHYPRHEAILDRAATTGADLILRIAGKHSRLERIFLSATDWELIRHAPQALWLVSGGSVSPDHCNVLAAVDAGHPDEHKKALDQALLQAAGVVHSAFPGELHLFNAFVPPTALLSVPIAAGAGAAAVPIPRVDDELVDEVRKAYESRLGELAKKVGVDEAHTHLGVGDAAAEIADAVDRYNIDVVVAGAVNRNWLQRWLIGSTTEAIFDAVDCDLYVVKLEDDENDN